MAIFFIKTYPLKVKLLTILKNASTEIVWIELNVLSLTETCDRIVEKGEQD